MHTLKIELAGIGECGMWQRKGIKYDSQVSGRSSWAYGIIYFDGKTGGGWEEGGSIKKGREG